jgi:hypothetical protein
MVLLEPPAWVKLGRAEVIMVALQDPKRLLKSDNEDVRKAIGRVGIDGSEVEYACRSGAGKREVELLPRKFKVTVLEVQHHGRAIIQPRHVFPETQRMSKLQSR